MVIGVVALIVIGPEKLPKVARTVGGFVGKAQRYAAQIRDDINRQIELEEFFRSHDLSFRCMKALKENNDAVYLYRISSPDRNYDLVNQFLLKHKDVKSFDV